MEAVVEKWALTRALKNGEYLEIFRKKNLRNFSHSCSQLLDSTGVSKAPKATLDFNFYPNSWKKHQAVLIFSDSGYIAWDQIIAS